ncbi:MAG: DUF350 domain-containing protein [Clostridia bacterium]|nr:DUF350 domain-containing protein [Clostridia bacterium]
MEHVVESLIYGGLGIILMFVGYLVFDLVVPYNFTDEIKEKNPAAGLVMAGIFIAVAIIIRSAIID